MPGSCDPGNVSFPLASACLTILVSSLLSYDALGMLIIAAKSQIPVFSLASSSQKTYI